MANSEQKGSGSVSVPGARRKAVPIAMASGPQDYTPGDQELPVQLTSRERVSYMELRGDHLVLTSVGIEEASALLPAFNGDQQFNQWSGHASALTPAQVQADMLGTLNQPGGVVWRIADWREALVGVAKTALLPSPDTAWIDLLIIRRAFQGHGYGSEAATLLETHLFSSPEIRQIGLAVMVQNIPAIAFWEKRGYVRGVRYLDNEGDDVYAYLLVCLASIA